MHGSLLGGAGIPACVLICRGPALLAPGGWCALAGPFVLAPFTLVAGTWFYLGTGLRWVQSTCTEHWGSGLAPRGRSRTHVGDVLVAGILCAFSVALLADASEAASGSARGTGGALLSVVIPGYPWGGTYIVPRDVLAEWRSSALRAGTGTSALDDHSHFGGAQGRRPVPALPGAARLPRTFAGVPVLALDRDGAVASDTPRDALLAFQLRSCAGWVPSQVGCGLAGTPPGGLCGSWQHALRPRDALLGGAGSCADTQSLAAPLPLPSTRVGGPTPGGLAAAGWADLVARSRRSPLPRGTDAVGVAGRANLAEVALRGHLSADAGAAGRSITPTLPYQAGFLLGASGAAIRWRKPSILGAALGACYATCKNNVVHCGNALSGAGRVDDTHLGWRAEAAARAERAEREARFIEEVEAQREREAAFTCKFTGKSYERLYPKKTLSEAYLDRLPEVDFRPRPPTGLPTWVAGNVGPYDPAEVPNWAATQVRLRADPYTCAFYGTVFKRLSDAMGYSLCGNDPASWLGGVTSLPAAHVVGLAWCLFHTHGADADVVRALMYYGLAPSSAGSSADLVRNPGPLFDAFVPEAIPELAADLWGVDVVLYEWLRLGLIRGGYVQPHAWDLLTGRSGPGVRSQPVPEVQAKPGVVRGVQAKPEVVPEILPNEKVAGTSAWSAVVKKLGAESVPSPAWSAVYAKLVADPADCAFLGKAVKVCCDQRGYPLHGQDPAGWLGGVASLPPKFVIGLAQGLLRTPGVDTDVVRALMHLGFAPERPNLRLRAYTIVSGYDEEGFCGLLEDLDQVDRPLSALVEKALTQG